MNDAPEPRATGTRRPPVTDAAGRDSALPKQPEQIGRYPIRKLLGQGGFGLVYLAYDAQLHREVAIKVPHRRLINRPEDAEAYLAEARTVANLDHPNIVTVHDVGSDENSPCFVVSKYINGKSLAKRLQEGPLNLTDATELVATIAEALHYAHGKRVVHRDVKPANILLDLETGRPYLCDFGIALREENVGRGPRYCGAAPYMSPEQARGEGHRVDGRSDIFSLGVVLYELITGSRPFRGETRDEVLEQIVHARLARRCEEPEGYYRLCNLGQPCCYPDK